ncbi:MAG: hypothetical protein ACOX28_00575 [Bacilli bacterium]|jgi:hypothetical protein
MRLFPLLESNRNTDFINKSNEYAFFQENKKILLVCNEFERFYNATDDFEIIQANILIRSLQNKFTIEEAVKNAGENVRDVVKITLSKLPYVTVQNRKVYVPIYLRTNNEIYSKTPEKLLEYPYSDLISEISDSLIDSFEEYNFDLFESSFSSLVYLDKDEDTRAYLHMDFLTIYIVNDQGRCDLKIPLFDKYIKRPVTNHLIERVLPLVKAYYDSDKETFIKILKEEHFISDKLFKTYSKRRK